MEKDRIQKLLAAYLAGKYSREGEQLFNLWYEKGQNDHLDAISDEDYQRLKTEILQSVRSNIKDKERMVNAVDSTERKGKQKHFSLLMKIAVAVSVLVVAATILFYQLPISSKISYKTGYDEAVEIQLPDQSIVYLNANSSLEFEENWQEGNSREVWLDGEAFFEVVKKETIQKGYKKFTVHTNNVNVEVLGTRFNVNSRRANTQIVLASGKVKLLTGNNQAIPMEPGDLVEVSSKEDKIIKKKVADVKIYSSWKEGKIMFDEMTLKNIAVWLEDHYGVQVTIQEDVSDETTFSASFQKMELETLLEVFEASFNVSITKDGNTLIISEKRKKLPYP